MEENGAFYLSSVPSLQHGVEEEQWGSFTIYEGLFSASHLWRVMC